MPIAPAATLEAGPGAAYSQAATTYHHVRVESGLTVTMFLEGRVTRSHSEVLLRPGQRLPVRTPRIPFAPGELLDRFARVSGALRGTRAVSDR
ncbi:hypothetical protein ITP53_26105 [Nonomuraea sp. K274]|uniref:Uncharacterized protein n=1 Tax=Nonomuraea cypriaca TaxID=1187855 RepID=A0A931F124_9ACTN|nr:hypothetical protein [Nonomuraea cypriaca]MBF8189142.1 hypothetical protein [Nonomuraea cypriaca]